jgi:hypothetical protein
VVCSLPWIVDRTGVVAQSVKQGFDGPHHTYGNFILDLKVLRDNCIFAPILSSNVVFIPSFATLHRCPYVRKVNEPCAPLDFRR